MKDEFGYAARRAEKLCFSDKLPFDFCGYAAAFTNSEPCPNLLQLKERRRSRAFVITQQEKHSFPANREA
ncbi:MAG: hypothetical protein ACKVRN_13225 [Pyrinomonadaceae bacterium]